VDSQPLPTLSFLCNFYRLAGFSCCPFETDRRREFVSPAKVVKRRAMKHTGPMHFPPLSFAGCLVSKRSDCCGQEILSSEPAPFQGRRSTHP
jgi:hypothetical protein